MAASYVAPWPADTLIVTGNDRVDLLHRLAANDLRPLAEPGRVVTTLLTTNQGRLIDWLWVVSQGTHLVARASPGRAGRVLGWLAEYTIMEDVQGADESAAWRWLVVGGPAAAALVGGALPAAGEARQLAGAILFAGLGAYGERLELGVPAAALPEWLARARAVGAEVLDAPALERLRLRAGVPGAGGEFADEINPLELHLGRHAVSFSKGCYVGQEVLNRLDSYDKVARLLVGVEGQGEPPRVADAKLLQGGTPIGRVTSVVRDGAGWVGLALVKRDAAHPQGVDVEVAGARQGAQLVVRPFWG